MAYAERVPSPAGDYWRGRYKDPDGRYLTVRDEHDQVIRYKTKREASQAADDAESDVRKGRWRDPASGRVKFKHWANKWYAGLDLAETTMDNRRRHLENHLIPFFGEEDLIDIDGELIGEWKRYERKQGNKESSISTWGGTLSMCLAPAVPKLIPANPALQNRRQGRQSGRPGRLPRGKEGRTVTDAPGIMAIAERMAILTGHDQDFILIWQMYTGALRLGETIGLEREYVAADSVDVEWQLADVAGKLIRCPPKADSYGTLDQPPYMAALIAGLVAASQAERCPCHGRAYVFRGMGAPPRRGNVPLRVIAAAAGVSQSAVSYVLAGKSCVAPRTRARVEAAITQTGYQPGPDRGSAVVWHWQRSTFREMLTAAVSGWFPPDGDSSPARPVYLAGDWPGVRVKGRNAAARADFGWLPVARGMTSHGARRSARTRMEEERIPDVAAETRLRHEIQGVSGAYRFVTETMRRQILEMLQADFEAALDARLELSPRSTVGVLDRLLLDRAQARKPRLLPRNSPDQPIPVRSSPSPARATAPRGHR
jgi:hypothetical protein